MQNDATKFAHNFTYSTIWAGCHDIEHDDTEHNDAPRRSTQHNGTLHNNLDDQHNDTLPNGQIVTHSITFLLCCVTFDGYALCC